MSTHESLAGTAGHKPFFAAVTIPEPWPSPLPKSPHYPEQLADLVRSLLPQHILLNICAIAAAGGNHIPATPPGMVRVLFARGYPGKLLPERREFVCSPPLVAPILEALCTGKNFPGAILETSPQRDILVCAHTTHDGCCGDKGSALARGIADDFASTHDVRIWRCTHLGGHRFAPTLLDLSTMRCWGRLDLTSARRVIARTGAIADLVSFYRGSALLAKPQEQIAETAALAHVGWPWLTYDQVVFAPNSFGKLTVNFAHGAHRGSFHAQIESAGEVLVRTSCRDAEGRKQPQYRLASFSVGP